MSSANVNVRDRASRRPFAHGLGRVSASRELGGRSLVCLLHVLTPSPACTRKPLWWRRRPTLLTTHAGSALDNLTKSPVCQTPGVTPLSGPEIRRAKGTNDTGWGRRGRDAFRPMASHCDQPPSMPRGEELPGRAKPRAWPGTCWTHTMLPVGLSRAGSSSLYRSRLPREAQHRSPLGSGAEKAGGGSEPRIRLC